MIRVDFYLLNSETLKPFDVACRLLEKAYQKGHQIYVYCTSQEEAEALDELLWCFRAESFVPHNLLGTKLDPAPPIQIGYEPAPAHFNDILLNLSHEIPSFHQQFQRIIEVVSEDQKEQSRIHYRTYRSKAYELNTHSLCYP